MTAGEDLFSAAFNEKEKDRAHFKDGKPSLLVSLSSSTKTLKTKSLSRPSARSNPLRLRLCLLERLTIESPYIDGWSCPFSFNVAPLSLSRILREKEVNIVITK